MNQPADFHTSTPNHYCSQPAVSCERAVTARDIVLAFLAFAAIAVALHSSGFHAPMIYDSRELIQNQEEIFARGGLLGVLRIVPMRPLFMGSLYLNYVLTGMDPFFFRLFNAIILAAAGTALALLTALILRVLGQWPGGSKIDPRVAGILVGLVFVVHPLQAFVVLYIWQRAAIMACFFYFAAMAAYLATRLGCMGRPWKGYAACALLFLAGMLTKENLATLPAILVLAELMLFRQTVAQTIRRGGVVAAMVLPCVLVYAAIAWSLRAGISPESGAIFQQPEAFYRLSGLTPLLVGLTACRVVFSYLFTILAPFLHEPQLINALTVSVSLWDPPVTAAACAGVVGLLGIGILLTRGAPLAAFGILSYFVLLLPESTLIPPYLCLGYRAILPMPSVLWVMLAGILAVMSSEENRITAVARPVIATCVCVVILGLGLMTVWQARNWQPLLLWQRAYFRLPVLSSRVEQTPYMDIASLYGDQLVLHRRYAEAIEVLTPLEAIGPKIGSSPELMPRGTGISPGSLRIFINPRAVIKAAALTNLGLAYALSGEPGTAIGWYRRALELDAWSAPAYINLGLALKQTGDPRTAIQCYRKALELDSRSVSAYNNLGLALEAAGNHDEAMQCFRQALKIAPASPEANYNLANALLREGNLVEAIACYERAVSARPDYAEANGNLAAALLNAGRFHEAIPRFQQALTTLSGNAELHFLLGVAFRETGKQAEAIGQFERALAINPGHSQARQRIEEARSEMRNP